MIGMFTIVSDDVNTRFCSSPIFCITIPPHPRTALANQDGRHPGPVLPNTVAGWWSPSIEQQYTRSLQRTSMSTIIVYGQPNSGDGMDHRRWRNTEKDMYELLLLTVADGNRVPTFHLTTKKSFPRGPIKSSPTSLMLILEIGGLWS